MYNKFRTLLLNQSYEENPQEHIPSDFYATVLPIALVEVYNALFPLASSRFFKLFLAQNYLKIIDSAGLTDDVLAFDSKITYSDNDSYFKINRYTNPIISSSSHPLFIYGQYNSNNTAGDYYDNYLITQSSNSLNISIFSQIRNKYVKSDGTYTGVVAEALMPLDFSDPNVSVPVRIGNTGVSFSIGGGASFTGSSNKTWEFIIEAPFIFDLLRVYNNLKDSTAADKLFNFNPSVDVTKYRNLWTLHFNPVYQLAGLLLAFVTKINAL